MGPRAGDTKRGRPAEPARRQRRFVRNVRAAEYLQTALVAAVATILVVRFYLRLTGYPQVGGEVIHVAHVLWGGLFLTVAVVNLLLFTSRRSMRIASVIGGVGFGLFIDEVGKFVTQDNDYFFRPAAAMIYAVFVILVLVVRMIQGHQRYSREEYLVNALREFEEVARHDLDVEERRRARRYLERSDPANPLVAPLGDVLDRVEPVAVSAPDPVSRLRRRLRAFYVRVAQLPGFDAGLVIFFGAQLLVRLGYVFALVFVVGLGREEILKSRFLWLITGRVPTSSFVHFAVVGSSLLSGVFVVLGVIRVRRSKLEAYRAFKRSVLVTIFLTQIFIFYEKQFEALIGLAFNVLVLVILDYMIDRERSAGREER